MIASARLRIATTKASFFLRWGSGASLETE